MRDQRRWDEVVRLTRELRQAQAAVLHSDGSRHEWISAAFARDSDKGSRWAALEYLRTFPQEAASCLPELFHAALADNTGMAATDVIARLREPLRVERLAEVVDSVLQAGAEPSGFGEIYWEVSHVLARAQVWPVLEHVVRTADGLDDDDAREFVATVRDQYGWSWTPG